MFAFECIFPLFLLIEIQLSSASESEDVANSPERLEGLDQFDEDDIHDDILE